MVGRTVYGWIDGWLEEWMDGYVDRWMDGWIDEWLDGQSPGLGQGKSGLWAGTHQLISEDEPLKV